MNIFKKQIKFVAAVCPNCKGNLQLDANLETAFCQYCGAQCIVENTRKKHKKQNALELLLDFIERQQDLRRQDKRERERKIEEQAQQQNQHLKKYGWIYALTAITTFVLLFIIAKI